MVSGKRCGIVGVGDVGDVGGVGGVGSVGGVDVVVGVVDVVVGVVVGIGGSGGVDGGVGVFVGIVVVVVGGGGGSSRHLLTAAPTRHSFYVPQHLLHTWIESAVGTDECTAGGAATGVLGGATGKLRGAAVGATAPWSPWPISLSIQVVGCWNSNLPSPKATTWVQRGRGNGRWSLRGH